VALGLAALSLVMFVVWNFMPNYEFAGDTEPDGIVATSLWMDEILSPDLYVQAFKAPNMDDFLGVAACMALILNALFTLALIPLWKMLHASSYIRVPLAIVNLLGGGVIVWIIYSNGSDEPQPYWFTILLLMATGMFALSAALFVFKNELALREERGRPQVG
jgi:uncharacterized protein YjeT (DUF2065 family)